MADDSAAGDAWAFEIQLDPGSDKPLYRQIADVVWLEVVNGTLDTGERLPTIRRLAIDIGVHPDTVSRAYQELEMLGVVIRRPGGTFVGLRHADMDALKRRRGLEQICRDAVTRARAAGFSLDDVVDTLQELRPSVSDAE